MPAASRRPDLPVLLVALAGLAVAGYLAWIKWTGAGALFCTAGAYWCPHCQEQKHKFGDAAGFLPYVECDSKGRNAQPECCERAGVRVFPTWVIGAERHEGVLSLEALAATSGLPKD
jgi:hypothetical protein